MDERARTAQNEIASASAAGATGGPPPANLDEVIAGLKGFGIEELEEILTIKCRGRQDARLRISNLPTAAEMQAVMAADELKGYLWIKRVKVELLSRSITWVGVGEGAGVSVRDLPDDRRWCRDPTDGGKVKDVQVVLRNLLLGWGQEITEILWKVLMTHAQNIENRMAEQFPDSATMTEVEARLFEQARRQIDDQAQIIVQEQVAKLYSDDAEPLEEPGAPEAPKPKPGPEKKG